MRVLVTGGAGFIGSHFVQSLLGGDGPGPPPTAVTVLDKLTYAGNRANLADVAADPRLRCVWGDICDAALLDRVVPGHDLVVDFAAETHVDRSISGPDAFVQTNVLGTHTLMRACLAARTPRVVHVSTDEVYGSIATGAWTEDAPLDPSSPYAAAKAAGDLIARSYARTEGLPVIISRCGNNYGPRQYPEKIIPLFVTRLLDGLPVPLYGDGGNVREWIHVRDHCRAVRTIAAAGEPGEVYHVGGGRELTNRELTDRLLRACGAGPDMVRHVTDRKGHDRRYRLDGSRLRALGFTPSVPFEEGLAGTVRWFARNRDWWEPLVREAPPRRKEAAR
ncbi:dTDP-glucose 4,6-dehydratase [Actinomadura viridis]|uniref:dTDP-glucose 4,6-dehydratase n=1 Tax=Actinomadura viridis TaxID=58110 RepID=UPI0036A7F898